MSDLSSQETIIKENILLERGNILNLKINNSKSHAITGKWKDPGAKLYDTLLDAVGYGGSIPTSGVELDKRIGDGKYIGYQSFLEEAYGIAPVDMIKNSPHGRTPFSKSGCRYPHHVIKGETLVLHIDGLKSAYRSAIRNHPVPSTLKSHLEGHFRQLGIKIEFHHGEIIFTNSMERRIQENFEEIESYIEAATSFDNMDEEDQQKVRQALNRRRRAKFIPIYGVSRSQDISGDPLRRDGTPKTDKEISSMKFAKILKKLTNGDNYSHSTISLDNSFRQMFSYDDEGFVIEDIATHGNWVSCRSIYITVMFVTPEEYLTIKRKIRFLLKNQQSTAYATSNLLKMMIGNPVKSDLRFVCSTLVGYLLHMSDSKTLHLDYARIRPEDITILPRAFYVGSFIDRQDFIDRQHEIIPKVKQLYRINKEELEDYNNHLPKLILKDRLRKAGRIDKVLDWLIDRM